MNEYRDWGGTSDEHQPVTYWRGYPIYAAHLIVIVYCTLMVGVAVSGSAIEGVIDALSFSSARVLSGQLWRWVTYGLLNFPSPWFALDMLMIVWFGRELERLFGRRLFLWLYAGIYLIAPIVLTAVGLVHPTLLSGQPGALALFIAFATQFPGMPVFFSLLAKWAALILVGIYALMALAARSWTDLILLASTCGFAHGFVRYQQGGWSLPEFRLPRRRPKLRTVPHGVPDESASAMSEMDSLLDKIARSGLGSLTTEERTRLETARKNLMRRSGGGR
ncbi:MAG: rhomboid family intramembrane serine protease [Verrucomicrobiota bacterium]